jgi:hypothetical protein
MKHSLTPQEKKQLSYVRDHVNRSCENQKAWRKSKPLKKKKAVRQIRKAVSDILRTKAEDADIAPRLLSLRQKKVADFGVQSLREHLGNRDRWRIRRVGLRKGRNTPNQAPEPTPTTVTPPAGQEARQP